MLSLSFGLILLISALLSFIVWMYCRQQINSVNEKIEGILELSKAIANSHGDVEKKVNLILSQNIVPQENNLENSNVKQIENIYENSVVEPFIRQTVSDDDEESGDEESGDEESDDEESGEEESGEEESDDEDENVESNSDENKNDGPTIEDLLIHQTIQPVLQTEINIPSILDIDESIFQIGQLNKEEDVTYDVDADNLNNCDETSEQCEVKQIQMSEEDDNEEIKNIQLSKDSDEKKKVTVGDLRNLVVEKGLLTKPEASKMKKQELTKLLS